MTSLLCCFLLTVSPAMAQANFSIEALLDDTGSPVEAPPAPTALWPTATTIDQVYQTLTIDWAAEPDESLPFAAILHSSTDADNHVRRSVRATAAGGALRHQQHLCRSRSHSRSLRHQQRRRLRCWLTRGLRRGQRRRSSQRRGGSWCVCSQR